MNTKELIEDLRNQMQAIEDAKTMLTESQEDIRATIAALQMSEVEA